MRRQIVDKVVGQAALGPLPGMNGFSFSKFGGIFACYLI
jgi:hypothetical protein